MFKIAKLEFKRIPLYWWVPVLLVLCVLFARFTYPMSIEGWDAGRIFELSVIYPESDAEEHELERLYDLTREVLHSADASELGQRYRGGVEFLESEGCYTLTDERLSDISPGGGLYEDGSELYLKAERMKVISGSVFELDDDLILAKFYLQSLVSDQSVPFLMSMLLAPLFFGRDFSRRVTGAAVSRGVDRGAYFRGKLLVYLLIAAAVSAADLAVCAATMERIGGAEVATLSQGYILRCFATRFLLDLLSLCVPVGICYVFRGYIWSALVSAVVMVVLVSQGSVASGLYSGAFSNGVLWQPELETGGVLALLRQLILPVISVVGGYMLFRRATLK